MSYSPPTYVDTKSQAILALASVIADDDKTALGDGSVNKALDVLADVLAESDVQVPQTNAGAILALAQYADGMIKPEGAITITENGEGIDVAQYATADVSVSGGGGGTTTTITLLELLNGDASDQLKITIETIDGETIETTTTTIIVEGDELPGFTFDVDAGAVVTLTADSGLTFNERTCMYGSGLNEPIEYSYPFSVDYETATTMMIVATNTDSYIVAELFGVD